MVAIKCPLCCKQEFESLLYLHEHLLYYIYRPFQCTVCGLFTEGIYHLTKHLEVHFDENESNHKKRNFDAHKFPDTGSVKLTDIKDLGNEVCSKIDRYHSSSFVDATNEGDDSCIEHHHLKSGIPDNKVYFKKINYSSKDFTLCKGFQNHSDRSPGLPVDLSYSTINAEIAGSTVGISSGAYFSEDSKQQDYFHKKFHIKKEKREFLPEDHIRQYMQNFQSLLVQRLNRSFENCTTSSEKFGNDPSIKANAVNTVQENLSFQIGVHRYKINSETEKEIIQFEALDNAAKTAESIKNKNDSITESANIPEKIVTNEHEDSDFKSKEIVSNVTFHKCPNCDKKFSKLFLLNYHIKEVHSAKKFDYSKRIVKRAHYIAEQKINSDHSAIVNQTVNKLKEVVCSICMKVFQKKYNLFRHIQRVHCEAGMSCDFCDKTFSCKDDLDEHLNYHTNLHSLTCHCNKVFSSTRALKRHSLIHEGCKSFVCEICDKFFSRKDSLNLHMLTHKNEKEFECNTCGKTFLRRCQLMVHAHKHNPPIYKCNKCKKKFKFKISLKNHSCIGENLKS